MISNPIASQSDGRERSRRIHALAHERFVQTKNNLGFDLQ